MPLILGGNSPGSEERALEYGDGWAPSHGEGVVERVAAFTAANPGVPVHVAGVPTEAGMIDAYGGAGAHRVVLNFGHVRPGDEGPILENLRETVDVAVG